MIKKQLFCCFDTGKAWLESEGMEAYGWTINFGEAG